MRPDYRVGGIRGQALPCLRGRHPSAWCRCRYRWTGHCAGTDPNCARFETIIVPQPTLNPSQASSSCLLSKEICEVASIGRPADLTRCAPAATCGMRRRLRWRSSTGPTPARTSPFLTCCCTPRRLGALLVLSRRHDKGPQGTCTPWRELFALQGNRRYPVDANDGRRGGADYRQVA
jgi:hypothetical protein